LIFENWREEAPKGELKVEKRAAALNEAGHTVAALNLGRVVLSTSINQTAKGWDGLTVLEELTSDDRKTMVSLVKVDSIVAMTGAMAEGLIVGGINPHRIEAITADMAAFDYGVNVLVEEDGQDGKETQAQLVTFARMSVDYLKPHIEELAGMLEAQGSLNQQQLGAWWTLSTMPREADLSCRAGLTGRMQ
jgi:hypothetical protein